MKKFLLSVVATLAFVGMAYAQSNGTSSYTTFTENDNCHVWVDSWDGGSTPGHELIALTVQGNDVIAVAAADVRFVFSAQTCAPVVIETHDIWLSDLDPAYDLDRVVFRTYDPAVMRASGCFEAGEFIALPVSRVPSATRQIDSTTVILNTDAQGDFEVINTFIESVDQVLDGCEH